MTECRHCENDLKYVNNSAKSCIFCKCMYFYFIYKYKLNITAEIYFNDNLSYALLEQSSGSVFYRVQLDYTESLSHLIDEYLVEGIQFKGFNDLNFHKKRLNALYKSQILR